jgi:cysteine synthase B
MRAHGAELLLTDPLEGYDHALRTAHRLADEQPERYWLCDQYANDENWRAHHDGTGEEILGQLAERGLGPPDALVVGVGTGGTLTGLGRRLRRANPEMLIAAAIPETFPGIEGLKPLGHPGDIVPPLLDQQLIDRRFPVGLEAAAAMCRRLAELGLFVGPSSGAFVDVALRLAAEGGRHLLVTVLSDAGERYVSTGLWP